MVKLRPLRRPWCSVLAACLLGGLVAVLALGHTAGAQTVPVVTIEAGPEIVEGQHASFVIRADPAPAGDLLVTLSLDQSYGVLRPDGTVSDYPDPTVTIKAGRTWAVYSIQTRDDRNDDACQRSDLPEDERLKSENRRRCLEHKSSPVFGYVNVLVSRGGSYRVGETINTYRASVKVHPAGSPQAGRVARSTVTVSGGAAVTEGTAATFTLTASPQAATPIPVKVSVTDSGDFAAAGQTGARTVLIASGATSASFTVATVNDDLHESDATITATVSTDDSVYTRGGPHSAGVTVNDDDVAVRSEITIRGSPSRIAEGADAVFTVTADPAPGAPTAVQVEITQLGDVIAASAVRTHSVTIASGASTGTLTVATTDDETDESDGAVRAAVLADSSYRRGDPSSASIVVADDDETTTTTLPPPETPSVSITLGASPVTEGTAATFTLTAAPAPSEAITVNVTVAQTGSFASPGQVGHRTVTIGAGGTATLTVGTRDDNTDEPHGTVTATIGVGAGYDPGSPGSAAVTVNDNDSPPLPDTSSPLLPDTSTSNDNPAPRRTTTPITKPTVRVTLEAEAITEGEGAVLSVTASPAPARTLDVRLRISQRGDFAAAGQTGTRTVRIVRGAGGVSLTVGTIDDDLHESDGTITATIVGRDAYEIHSPTEVTVTVRDNDPAETDESETAESEEGGGQAIVTVVEPDAQPLADEPASPVTVTVVGGSGVTEGQDAVFTIAATRAPDTALEVQVTIARDGNFVAARNRGGLSIVLAAGETSVVHGVPTLDGPNDEPDGMVHLRLRGGDGYFVGEPSAASVSVADNDPPASGQEPAQALQPTATVREPPQPQAQDSIASTAGTAPPQAVDSPAAAPQAEEFPDDTAQQPDPDTAQALPDLVQPAPTDRRLPLPQALLVLLGAGLTAWLALVALRRRRDESDNNATLRVSDP